MTRGASLDRSPIARPFALMLVGLIACSLAAGAFAGPDRSEGDPSPTSARIRVLPDSIA
jgi:hypothetical protein